MQIESAVANDEHAAQRPKTFSGRPSVYELGVGIVVLVLAGVGSLLAGPGFGVLILTMALLAAALWIAYATPPAASGRTPPPGPSRIDGGAKGAGESRLAHALPHPKTPSVSVDRANVSSLGFLSAVGSILGIMATGGFLFLKDRAVNPPGFFSDEAEIGIQSLKLLHWNADTTRIPFFYHHLDYEHLGTLVLFATAPFVGLFGLTENAVRGASAFWVVIGGIAIYLTLRRLKVPYAVAPVIVTLMSPLVILIARTNFGHAASFAAMCIGYLVWVIARQGSGRRLPVAAGLLIGLSAYGQASYYIAVPLFLLAIGLVEVFYNRGDWHAYRPLAWMGGTAVAMLLPIPYRALTYAPFLDRYRDKTSGGVHGFDRLSDAIHAYPHYFSYDMLFVRGTTGWQTRHTIPGAPWFFTVVFVALLIGFAAMILMRDDPFKRFFLPMALVLLFYPIPDLASQPDTGSPYSFSLIWASIAIPFVIGYGLTSARQLLTRFSFVRPALLYASAMLLVSVVSVAGFWRGAFANYPNVSADFWGWQYGAKPIMENFEANADQYDQFIMSSDFNAAYILDEFFSHGSSIAGRTQTGDLGDLDLSQRQLFAVRVAEWESTPGSQYPARSYMTSVGTIYYPNGDPAFFLLAADSSLLKTDSGVNQTPAG